MKKPERYQHLDKQAAIEKLVREYYSRTVNSGDFRILDEMIGDFTACANNLWSIEGVEGIRASIERTRAAFSEINFEITDFFMKEDVEVEPGGKVDLISIWWQVSGIHTGELVGIEPSKKPIKYHGASLLYFQDYKMVGARALSDIYQQLGQLPPH